MDLTLRELGAGDEDELQALLESDPDYTVRVTGYPPGCQIKTKMLLFLFCKKKIELNKVVYG
jgi:hypothetical protein